MSSSASPFLFDENLRSKTSFRKHASKAFLILIIIVLLITTITFAILWKNQSSFRFLNKFSVENGIIGFPPILPNDGKYIEWTILHLNDVYEMLPLDEGKKGGLARVAHLRELLLQENPLTFTILSGDFLSPSALSQSKLNGTMLNGKQMIASFNTLGLDFVTFGNHEFDLNETELISRMNESKFTWISSNVFQSETNQSFSSSIRYKLIHIHEVRILIIGLTIDNDDKSYIEIINQTSLIPFVKQFIKSISDIKYDVLIALTHLDLSTDIQLSENIPQIDLILGGHEHEDYFLLRGSNYTPIYKADGNAFTVYIHRCAFNLNTKQFRIYSTLTKVTSRINNEPKTNEVVNYWYNLGIKGFQDMGFQPNQTVSCLPTGIELDGKSASVRNFETLLSRYCCECMINTTAKSKTIVGIYDSGTIRIDDVLRGKITQYDILRTLPYQNNLFALSVPSEILGNVLRKGISIKGNGMFLVYCGIETMDEGKTWLINGKDISKSGLTYNVVTTAYARKHDELNGPKVIVLEEYNITHTKSLINYLPLKYPPC
jgi:5'-nucleotidase/UDP-sugar diphosphatase